MASADGFDEVDVALLDALHVNPRVSFEKLGAALGLSPVTAARRWQRLSESGRAWVCSVLGPRAQAGLALAVYEAQVAPGSAERVGRALAELPQVVSVYLTAGEFDLHALVLAADMTELTALVLGPAAAVPAVTRTRTQVGLAWYSDVHWRLGAISSGEERTVLDGEPDVANGRGAAGHFAPADRELYLALQPDGRARYRDLAHRLDRPEHLVRRRMAALVKQGMLAFRTDFARGEGGWPAQVILWLTVPDELLHPAGAQLGGWRETRICMSVVGTANLFLVVQLHRLAELPELLRRVRAAVPGSVVADQRVVLRPVKSWGRLLDQHGHAIGVVPTDPWAAIAAS